jgi:hypothetical protein
VFRLLPIDGQSHFSFCWPVGGQGCVRSQFGDQTFRVFSDCIGCVPDNETTEYGQHSSLEDFADYFAVTILFNAPYGLLQSQKRIDLINQTLEDAVNETSP